VDEQRRVYLKVPEVAEVLRIARSRAYELVGSGEIPSVRIGRGVRVGRKELDRWLEEQRQPSARWRYSKKSTIASWCRS
jgi:excisionase family DNA binding protein